MFHCFAIWLATAKPLGNDQSLHPETTSQTDAKEYFLMIKSLHNLSMELRRSRELSNAQLIWNPFSASPQSFQSLRCVIAPLPFPVAKGSNSCSVSENICVSDRHLPRFDMLSCRAATNSHKCRRTTRDSREQNNSRNNRRIDARTYMCSCFLCSSFPLWHVMCCVFWMKFFASFPVNFFVL